MKVRKLVQGVGINDADYTVSIREIVVGADGKRKQRLVWRCPFYRTWDHMLERCYSKAYHQRKPTYTDCIVCEEWLIFSNFKSWMQAQDWEGNQLDKDLLLPGNKVYSPESCIFVSRRVNLFMIECNAKRGEWPIGVHWNKLSQKYIARIGDGNGSVQHIGSFTTPEAAHAAWLSAKLELAYELAAEQTDERVAKALIARYETYEIV